MTDHDTLYAQLEQLIDNGLTFAHCTEAFNKRVGTLQEGLVESAMEHRLLAGGVLEVDSTTVVSTDEEEIEEQGGGYVMAWLWVDND